MSKRSELDEQDLNELATLVLEAFWKETMSNVRSNTIYIGQDVTRKPTNRMVMLKALEAKLIEIKAAL